MVLEMFGKAIFHLFLRHFFGPKLHHYQGDVKICNKVNANHGFRNDIQNIIVGVYRSILQKKPRLTNF